MTEEHNDDKGPVHPDFAPRGPVPPEVVERLLAADGQSVTVRIPTVVLDDDGNPTGVEVETVEALLVTNRYLLTGEDDDDDD